MQCYRSRHQFDVLSDYTIRYNLVTPHIVNKTLLESVVEGKKAISEPSIIIVE